MLHSFFTIKPIDFSHSYSYSSPPSHNNILHHSQNTIILSLYQDIHPIVNCNILHNLHPVLRRVAADRIQAGVCWPFRERLRLTPSTQLSRALPPHRQSLRRGLRIRLSGIGWTHSSCHDFSRFGSPARTYFIVNVFYCETFCVTNIGSWNSLVARMSSTSQITIPPALLASDGVSTQVPAVLNPLTDSRTPLRTQLVHPSCHTLYHSHSTQRLDRAYTRRTSSHTPSCTPTRNLSTMQTAFPITTSMPQILSNHCV